MKLGYFFLSAEAFAKKENGDRLIVDEANCCQAIRVNIPFFHHFVIFQFFSTYMYYFKIVTHGSHWPAMGIDHEETGFK